MLELLDCVAGPDANVPEAYCIYQPLASGNLHDFAAQDILSFATLVALVRQYLEGLAHLHEKGFMHRDIKPSNLGIVTLNPPTAVILDLDSATRCETSDNHRVGTLGYLAPEIVNLKFWELAANREEALFTSAPAPYGRKIDVWALGISAYTIETGATIPSKCITQDFYEMIQRDMERGIELELGEDNAKASFLKVVMDMLAWSPLDV